MSTSKEDLVNFWNDLSATSANISEQLMNLRAKLDGLITNWPVTPPPPPVPAANRLRFGVHKYDNSPGNPVNYASADVFDLQRGFTPVVPADKEVYIFTSMLRRPSDEDGLTQFLPPAEVPDIQCVHLKTGGVMSRTRGEGPENLVNFSHPVWQSRAIDRMIAECRRYNANCYLDEVDYIPDWAWPTGGGGTAEFSNNTNWRIGLLQFIRNLAGALHQEGRKLWINLGADYSVEDVWQHELLSIVDGVNIEFFVGREGVGQPVLMAGDWEKVTVFIRQAEAFGVPVHVRCSSTKQNVVDYAFCSWLAGTLFKGSFSASTDYAGPIKRPSNSVLTAALRLGLPTGPYLPDAYGYRRQFQNGIVRVNPFTTPRVSLPPATGQIVLT